MKKVSRNNVFTIICVILLVISCFSLFSVFINKESSEDNTSNSIDWSQISISCLGDSITYGQTISNPYPQLLKESLGVKSCLNYGIGWSTCAVVNDCTCHSGVSNSHNAMCVRYKNMPTTSDIIIVMCGVNDSGLVELGNIDDTSSNTFYGSLNILCNGLKSKYSNSYIFFMTSFDYDNSNVIREDGTTPKDYYCTAVKEVCNNYDIDIFDTYNLIDFSTSADTTDNVHPNQNFVTNKWTPQIAQFIKDNYNK